MYALSYSMETYTLRIEIPNLAFSICLFPNKEQLLAAVKLKQIMEQQSLLHY